jgi:uncharacterized Tic20 family protein
MAEISTCQKHVNLGKISVVILGIYFSNIVMASFCPDCKKQRSEPSSTVSIENQLTMNTGSNKAMLVHLTPLLIPLISFPIVPSYIGLELWYLILLFPVLLIYVPALIVLVRSKSNDFERRHAIAYLNFELSLIIYIGGLVGAYWWIFNYMSANSSGAYQGINSPIAFLSISFALVLLAFISVIVALNVRGATAAFRGLEYRYPIAIRFLK